MGMKSWIKRPIRTFFQSAIGYIVIALPAIDWGEDTTVLKKTLIGIGISSLSAGISAVMNYIDDSQDNNS